MRPHHTGSGTEPKLDKRGHARLTAIATALTPPHIVAFSKIAAN
jgi:hypothetical protein